MALVANEVKTPKLFAQAIREVKAAIESILNTQLVPEESVEGEKVPAIVNRSIVDSDSDQWSAKLESDRHVEDGRKQVNTFGVAYGGIQTSKATGNSSRVGRKGFTLRFVLFSYLRDDIGTDADNAEEVHNEMIATVLYAIYRNRTLGIGGLVDKLGDFRERRGMIPMGTGMVRQSLGELFVQLHPVPIDPAQD